MFFTFTFSISFFVPLFSQKKPILFIKKSKKSADVFHNPQTVFKFFGVQRGLISMLSFYYFHQNIL